MHHTTKSRLSPTQLWPASSVFALAALILLFAARYFSICKLVSLLLEGHPKGVVVLILDVLDPLRLQFRCDQAYTRPYRVDDHSHGPAGLFRVTPCSDN